MEAWRIADLHAYVDDCLEPDERLAFEHEMARGSGAGAPRRGVARAKQRDPRRLRRRGRESLFDQPRSPPERAFRQGQTAGGGRRQSAFRASGAIFIAHDCGRLAIFGEGRCAPRISSVALMAPRASRRWPSALPSFGLRPRPSSRRKDWQRPALRLSRHSPVRALQPVEFATGDRTEAQAWLTPRLMHPVHLPATPSAVRLLGARIAPYPGAPAAFLRLQNRKSRLVGLLVQSLDAPATRAPRARRGGRPPRGGMDMARSGICPGRRPRRRVCCSRSRPISSGRRTRRAQAAPDRGLIGLLIPHLAHQGGQFRIRLVRQNDPKRRQEIAGGLVGASGKTFAPQPQHATAVGARSDRDFDLAAQRRRPHARAQNRFVERNRQIQPQIAPLHFEQRMGGVSNGHDDVAGRSAATARDGPDRAIGSTSLLRCRRGPRRRASFRSARRRGPTRHERSSPAEPRPRRRYPPPGSSEPGCARGCRPAPNSSDRMSGSIEPLSVENPPAPKSKPKLRKSPRPPPRLARQSRNPRIAAPAACLPRRSRRDRRLCASCRRPGFRRPSRPRRSAPSPSAPCSGRDGISWRACETRI